MINAVTTLGFGLLLGIKHAFEADHLIAVSTILAQQNSVKRAALIGTFWGIGHTTTLFAIGLAVLFLRLSIPEYISQKMEILVGFMLILLGIQSVLTKPALPQNEHEHDHDKLNHAHLHQSQFHQHGRSFLIGSVHGLAGSGAMMLLVLSVVHSVREGIFYIILFGIGSTFSMTLLSLLIGIPFAKSMAGFSGIEKYIRMIIGSVSVIFGIIIVYNLL